jgi:hypothetical protein
MSTDAEPELTMPFDELRAWIAASYDERYIVVTITATDPEFDEDDNLVKQPYWHEIEAREVEQYGDENGSGMVESVVHGSGVSLDEAAAQVLAAAVRP